MIRSNKKFCFFVVLSFLFLIISCKTKFDLRNEKDAAVQVVQDIQTKKIIFLGNNHNGAVPTFFLTENLKKFYDAGVRYLFLEGDNDNYISEPEKFKAKIYPIWGHFGYNFEDIKYNMGWTFEERELIEKMEKSLPEFDFFKWGQRGADIIVKGNTKAKGIQIVLDKLGYDLKDTYAIGDSSNDVPMFKLVNTPIAMGNGTEDAKQHAKHITLTQDEGGIEFALDNIIKGIW